VLAPQSNLRRGHLRSVRRLASACTEQFSRDNELTEQTGTVYLSNAGCGLLVVEVKDWVPAQIVEMSPLNWTIERNGMREVHESPTEQARKCFIGFKELLQRRPEFRHSNGPHSGNLKFPIGYCAIFTNVTRKQATESGVLGVLDETQCLFSDDLAFDSDSRDARREFISKLKKSFAVRFNFEPLTNEQLKVLRFLIFPEVRVPSVRKLRNEEQTRLVKTLDLDQERTAKSISEGHRVLKGVAGSAGPRDPCLPVRK